MIRLSIVVPVFNALPSLKITLRSIINTTDNLYEIIIVDDHSEEETRAFIDGLRIEDNLNCRLIKTRNVTHQWTNASWNVGVKLASGSHIAILNSDISLSNHWDTALIRKLATATVACPYLKLNDGSIQKLDPLIEKVDPKMINGACFMFEEKYKYDWIFPIPDCLTHWYGDRCIADRANNINGVAFTKNAQITHGVTQSGRLIEKKLYLDTVYRDLLNYEEFTGKDESLIMAELDKQKNA